MLLFITCSEFRLLESLGVHDRVLPGASNNVYAAGHVEGVKYFLPCGVQSPGFTNIKERAGDTGFADLHCGAPGHFLESIHNHTAHGRHPSK